MKKASVLLFAMAAVVFAACSSKEESDETNAEEVQEVTYTLDTEASTLKWHGEENESHYHDGVITVTEGSMIMAGDAAVSGSFTIDPSTIQGQTEGYPDEKMDYLSSHLKDTAFLFTAEYPTIKVTTGAYENGELAATINVRGVDLKTKIPVKVEQKDDKAMISGKFGLDFSPVGMPYLAQINEETGEPAAKSNIQFDMNLVLNKK
jgi:polyisoprenoid-binding protein YceI